MKLPEVPLPAGALLIGDLHLDPGGGETVERFLSWLGELRARGCPCLVVLGDLFEFWVGPAQLEESAPILSALRALVEDGTAVHVLHGNRDFLLDRRFEERSGARVFPNGFVGRTPGGERVLVVHGDELCTLDHAYQRLRRTLRSAPVRALAPRLPVVVSRYAARRLRGASRRAVARKPTPEMEQQARACLELASANACSALVCGHAHRFRDELLEGRLRWFVVDAFGGERDTLAVGPDGSLALYPG